MYTLDAFLSNYPLISAILGWCVAQTLKIFTSFAQTREFHFGVIFASGGMPSSHSATVCALTAACAIQYGFASPEAAISFVLAMIVMHDASGVRWETGEQAKLINKMMNEIFSGKPDEINTGLKELVGHTPFQVVMGAILGIVIALAMWTVIG